MNPINVLSLTKLYQGLIVIPKRFFVLTKVKICYTKLVGQVKKIYRSHKLSMVFT